MRSVLIATLFVTFAIVGCTKGETPPADPPEGSPPAATVALEVACGHCVYKMEGLTSCTMACKVDGETLLLEGEVVDGKALMGKGVCTAPVQAKAAGAATDGKFVASSLTLE